MGTNRSVNSKKIIFLSLMFSIFVVNLVLPVKTSASALIDGRMIVGFYGPTQDIYAFNYDGTNPRLLTNTSTCEGYPSVSPDAGKIAFIRYANCGSEYNGQIRIMDLETGDLNGNASSWVYSTSDRIVATNISRDGSKIVFAKGGSINENIYIINSDGTDLINLSNWIGGDSDPDISPDGTTIAWGSNGGIPSPVASQQMVYLINSDGTNKRALLDPSGNSIYGSHVRWSPDGTKLLITRDHISSWKAYVVTLIDINHATYTELVGSGPLGAWSPDGTMIVLYDYWRSTGKSAIVYSDGGGIVGDVDATLAYFYIWDWWQDNYPPSANAGFDQTIEEGLTAYLSGAASSDPEEDELIYHWDVISSSGPDITLSSVDSMNTSFLTTDNGSYIFRLTISDGKAEPISDDVMVTVNNIAPMVGQIIGPIDPQQVNNAINVNADFTDQGTADTHTVSWDWGDGTTSEGVVSELDGSGNASGSHIYSQAGIYTIGLKITDDDGMLGESYFEFAIVYDPNGGFVTGGGWIISPSGAYVANPALTGKATFGFVARYHKGAQVPDGQTEFQFKVADFIFRSTSYNWLVVAGSRAQFKGTGTINGNGNYGFMLTAKDGTPDTFRIKIWDMVSGAIIYDNMLDAAVDTSPTTMVGGGSIIIHK